MSLFRIMCSSFATARRVCFLTCRCAETAHVVKERVEAGAGRSTGAAEVRFGTRSAYFTAGKAFNDRLLGDPSFQVLDIS